MEKRLERKLIKLVMLENKIEAQGGGISQFVYVLFSKLCSSLQSQTFK
jgi:hypothetical protein